MFSKLLCSMLFICVFASATFSQSYTLTMQNDGKGTATPASFTGTNGTPVAVTATPTAAGYRFSNWQLISGDATIERTDTAITRTFVANYNSVIKANFCLKTCTLTVATNGGGSAGHLVYDHGTPTYPPVLYQLYNVLDTIAAAPLVNGSTDYRFVNWTVTSGGATIVTQFLQRLSENEPPVKSTVKLTTNAVITENFKRVFAASAIPMVGVMPPLMDEALGTVTPASEVTVDSGAPLAITATPITGYKFTGWEVVREAVEGSTVITNPASASTTAKISCNLVQLQANFAIKTYRLTLITDGHPGATTNVTDTLLEHGQSFFISYEPGPGTRFLNWSVASGTATITSDYIGTRVTLTSGDATVKANFKKIYVLRTRAVTGLYAPG